MTVTQEQLDAAVEAALQGPEKRDLRIGHRSWNVKPAHMIRNGSMLRVEGNRGHHISRRRSWGPNDRYYYVIEKEGSKLKNLDIDRSGGWARTIAWIIDTWEEIEAERERLQQQGKSDAAAANEAAWKTRDLLDGSSRGIAAYVITNIALRAK